MYRYYRINVSFQGYLLFQQVVLVVVLATFFVAIVIMDVISFGGISTTIIITPIRYCENNDGDISPSEFDESL